MLLSIIEFFFLIDAFVYYLIFIFISETTFVNKSY